MDFNVCEDTKLIREMLNISQEEMANEIGVRRITILRIENKDTHPGSDTVDKIYSFAYKKGIKINAIKELFYREEITDKTLVFHGAKAAIKGEVSLGYSKERNDFGKGFYCGESGDQAISYVAKYPEPSLYIASFDKTDDLASCSFDVNQEWMLAVAFYRGKIDKYKNHPLIQSIIRKVEEADYVYAPIADNRMFMIIDQFIDGLITDEQCKHCLAATNLGNQYVLLTDKALSKLKTLERCFISSLERAHFISIKEADVNDGDNKVKAAMIKYRGKGKYIEELLDENN